MTCPKILAVLLVLMAAAYCQEHHHHTTSLKTVIKHEIPKKVEHHHHKTEHKAPDHKKEVHAEPKKHGHAVSSQSVVRHDTHHSHGHESHHHESPKHYFTPAHHEPAPVHEVTKEVEHHAPIQYHVQQKAKHVEQKKTQHKEVQHKEVHHKETKHKEVKHKETHHKEAKHKEAHHKESHHEHYVDYYAHPKYEFEYKVDDPHTGDKKYQHESRDGDVVKGEYGLHEADGSIRTVKYSSDKKTGFNAEVSHKGDSKHEHHYHNHH